MHHLALPEAVIESGQRNHPRTSTHALAFAGIMYFSNGIVRVGTWLSYKLAIIRLPLLPSSPIADLQWY